MPPVGKATLRVMSETKQTETTQQPNEAARNDKRKNKTIVLLLLLLLVMIGLIGGLLYYFLIYSAKSPMARESEMLGAVLPAKLLLKCRVFWMRPWKRGRC